MAASGIEVRRSVQPAAARGQHPSRADCRCARSQVSAELSASFKDAVQNKTKGMVQARPHPVLRPLRPGVLAPWRLAPWRLAP